MGMDWKECTLDSSGGGTEKNVVKIFRERIQNIATGVSETKKGGGQHIWTRFQKIAIGNCGSKRVGSRQWRSGSKKNCRWKGTKEGCGLYIRAKGGISYIPWCIASYYIIKLSHARDPISSTGTLQLNNGGKRLVLPIKPSVPLLCRSIYDFRFTIPNISLVKSKRVFWPPIIS